MALLQQKQSKLIEEERKVRGVFGVDVRAGGSIGAGGGASATLEAI